MLAQEFEKMYGLVQDTWKRIAAEEFSIPVGGCITTIAFHMSLTFYPKYLESYDIKDMEMLFDRYESCKTMMSHHDRDSSSNISCKSIHDSAPFAEKSGLQEIAHAFRDFKKSWTNPANDKG